jgi:hypothetical protein
LGNSAKDLLDSYKCSTFAVEFDNQYTYMHTKKILLFLLASMTTALSLLANDATDAHIAGHVLDAHSGEHLSFVNVQVKGTSLGCLTDESGHFYLKNLPEGKLTLVFSMMGYEAVEKSLTLQRDTLIEMNVEIAETSFMIDNVVVTANKYETKQKEVATIVNVISPLIIESTSSNSMADVLNFQTGLRVEETCSNCGVPQIRINGLEGQYTQILMDSRPIFSSLASVYGLEQLPAGMVDRIEVIRGGGSALYGANAIAGVVNIITKEPARNFFNVSNSSAFTETGSYDNRFYIINIEDSDEYAKMYTKLSKNAINTEFPTFGTNSSSSTVKVTNYFEIEEDNHTYNIFLIADFDKDKYYLKIGGFED